MGYVEEVTSGPPPIQAAETSVCAFVGPASAGPTDVATRIVTTAAAEEAYGDGWLVTAATDFFAQGGRTAVLARTDGPGDPWPLLEEHDVQLLVVDPALVDLATAYAWCVEHRAFLVADAPGGVLPDGLGRDAAVYHPALTDGAQERPAAPAVAGVFARTDATRGVWKAPAGTSATVSGLTPVVQLDEGATDDLAARHVNPLRVFSGQTVVWGGRTADTTDPEWKYVPVRRFLLFLERSLDDGLSWVVFEPNAEPLWLAVRRQVEDFLTTLWREGALQGQTSDEGFFVRCGPDTTTQADLDNGRLVVEVGVAPVRPAEFVILRIGLWTRDRPDP